MMSLAMMAGLPHAAHAKNGKEGLPQVNASWNTPYMPHYGAEGIAHPLMDHVSVSSMSGSGQNMRNAWRLDFMPPAPVVAGDDPLNAKDKRVGFSLKLNF